MRKNRTLETDPSLAPFETQCRQGKSGQVPRFVLRLSEQVRQEGGAPKNQERSSGPATKDTSRRPGLQRSHGCEDAGLEGAKSRFLGGQSRLGMTAAIGADPRKPKGSLQKVQAIPASPNGFFHLLPR